ncbi:MAG: hypothetical protein ABI847_11000 [Anaerolineales bacterium]
MRRFWIELAAQLAGLVIIGFTIGVTALIFGGAVGGTAVGVAPEYHVRLLGGLGLLCQKGETVTFHDGGQVTTTDSDGFPSTGTAIDISCDSPDGSSRMLSTDESIGGFLGIIGLVLAGYFLVCFVPLFVPLEIVAIILIHRVVGSMTKPKMPGALAY